MKVPPDVAREFATSVLEELSLIRGELISQRKMLIELLSRVSKEPRRKIKDGAYDRRMVGLSMARDLKRQVGLERKYDLP